MERLCFEPLKMLADLGNPVTLLISGLSAGQIGGHRQHLKSGSWGNLYWEKFDLQPESTFAKHLLSSHTFEHLQKWERPNLHKESFSVSFVNDRLNLQRILLRESNQILYDNRSPFKIFSLVPIWTVKISQESLFSAHTPSPSFLFTLKMLLKYPWPNLGFGKWGHCTQLHLEVRSGSGLVPGHPGQALERGLETLLCLDSMPPLRSIPRLESLVFLSVMAPTSPIFYQQMKECPFCHYQQLFLKKSFKIIPFLKMYSLCSQGNEESALRIKSFPKPTLFGEH